MVARSDTPARSAAHRGRAASGARCVASGARCVAALLLCAGLVACQSGPPPTPLERADAAFAAGRLDDALSLYDEAARTQPDRRAEALHGAARVYTVRRRPEQTLALYAEVARADRDYFVARARADYARALLQAGEKRRASRRFEAAIEALQALQRIDAGYPGLAKALAAALTEHGEALAVEGRRTEALARFEEAMAVRPQAADAWVGAAEILIATGRSKEALQLLGDARRYNPSDGRVRALTVQAMGVY